MAGSFRTLRKYLAPRWLTEGDGELLGYSLDLLKDAFAERARQGLLARFPQQGPDGTPAPSDALAAMGRDRRVVRGIDETATAYAARMLRWIDDRKRTGNMFSLMDAVAAYLGPATVRLRTVDQRGNWCTREPGGARSYLLDQGNWNWDGTPATQWSRFWLIVYPRGVWTDGSVAWGSGGSWGEAGHVWGLSATPDEAATLRGIVDDQKPAGTRCVSIIVAFDEASFDPAAPEPDGTWGKWHKVVAGVSVPSRLATARYIDGV